MKKTESTFEQKMMEKTVADWMWGAIWEAEDALLTEHKNEMAGLRIAKLAVGFWEEMEDCAEKLLLPILDKWDIDKENKKGLRIIMNSAICDIKEIYERRIEEWEMEFKNAKMVTELELARLSVIKSTMEDEIRGLLGR